MVETDFFDVLGVPVPFAMRPGLQRLDCSAQHLHSLPPHGQLAAEKRAAWASSDLALIAPGFDAEAAALILRALRSQCEHDAIQHIATHTTNTLTGGLNGVNSIDFDPRSRLSAFLKAVSLAVQQDLAVLDARPCSPYRTGLPVLCVACPSHWRPEEKIGLPLAAVHAPVADSAMLVKASESLAAVATNGAHWQRWVWTITPSSRYDAHPHRHPARAWPRTTDPIAFAQACHLRSERQTFFPVLAENGAPSGLAIFTIRVQLTPLLSAVPTPAQALALGASIASMSDAVLAYKGLADAREMLLEAMAALNKIGAS